MNTVNLNCFFCGVEFNRSVKEYNRCVRIGRRFYCSNSCSAKINNIPKKAKEIIKNCLLCGVRFKSNTKTKSAKYCSRSCASKGSMSDSRREAQRRGGINSGLKSNNLISIEEALKKREPWKYVSVKELLDKSREKYEFEFRIGNFIFDLALLDKKIIVEFDSPYHNDGNQKKIDTEKEKIAQDAGFFLIRRPVQPMTIIHPNTIAGLTQNKESGKEKNKNPQNI